MNSEYTIYNILNEWRNNKNLHAYIKGNKIEGYKHHDESSGSCSKVMGVDFRLFILLSIVVIVIWIFTVWSMWQYWEELPEWAKIVSLIFLLSPRSGGPLLALLIVYFSKC